jgi:hypothetical protein
MGSTWRIISKGARWIWKNSWWIVPAGEEIYDRVRKVLKKKIKGKTENDQELWRKESGS